MFSHSGPQNPQPTNRTHLGLARIGGLDTQIRHDATCILVDPLLTATWERGIEVPCFRAVACLLSVSFVLEVKNERNMFRSKGRLLELLALAINDQVL